MRAGGNGSGSPGPSGAEAGDAGWDSQAKHNKPADARNRCWSLGNRAAHAPRREHTCPQRWLVWPDVLEKE